MNLGEGCECVRGEGSVVSLGMSMGLLMAYGAVAKEMLLKLP